MKRDTMFERGWTQIVRGCLLTVGLWASGMRADEPLHFDGAVTLLTQITNSQAAGVFADAQGVSINRYGGSWGSASNPSFVRFEDPVAGILPGNNTKCASLVTHLFKNLYNWNWKDHPFVDPIQNAVKTTVSPEAYQYCALIDQEVGFSRIETLDLALPGDILSWWLVGSSSSDHTMIFVSVNWASAKAYPTNLPASNPALFGTTYYEVQVIDSSSDTHTADSRLVSVGGQVQQIAGIGTGVIGILANANLEIVGRTWSLPTSNYVTQTSTWLNSLHSRLKLAPTWGFSIGRFAGQ